MRDGSGLAEWVDALRAHPWNGVYLIRDARTREVLYIGESHRGKLFQTLTRHLYQWNGKGSGPSYHPGAIQVAVLLAETPLDDPVEDQYGLIQRLEPRDNVLDGHSLFWRTRGRKSA
jgi:hypothetical protein